MLQLRPYQREAIDSLPQYFQTHTGNPLLVLPTGSGKSLVQAAFIQETLAQWPATRFLCLTHVKELIRQNADELRQLWLDAPMGIYSAGLNRRDTDMPITIAGIASVFNKATDLGRMDLVLIDECHLVSVKNEGMYAELIRDMRIINPSVKFIGLTATPYRLGSGLLTEGEGAIFTHIAYEASLTHLIQDGYLAPLRSRAAECLIDLSKVATRAGEYAMGELEATMNTWNITSSCIDEVMAMAQDRKSWLFFCCGVDHAMHVHTDLGKRGITSGCITADTPKEERDDLVEQFKNGKVRALTNANVLTTGFNAPAVDLLVMLRPTMSTSLYVQMAGRGMRCAPGKVDCLVLDYAGNVMRHGPVDAIDARPPAKRKGGDAPAKMCEKCRALVHTGCRQCPDCGNPFPEPDKEQKLSETASKSPVLTSEMDKAPEVRLLEVRSLNGRQAIDWRVHEKYGAEPGTPKTLKVTYNVGPIADINEYVCFEHTGYARTKAVAWWRECVGNAKVPTSSIDALDELDLMEKVKSRIPLFQVQGLEVVMGQFPEIRKRIYTAKPKGCATCVHFDNGECLSWGEKIPRDWLAIGCDRFSGRMKARPTVSVPGDDEPPF